MYIFLSKFNSCININACVQLITDYQNNYMYSWNKITFIDLCWIGKKVLRICTVGKWWFFSIVLSACNAEMSAIILTACRFLMKADTPTFWSLIIWQIFTNCICTPDNKNNTYIYSITQKKLYSLFDLHVFHFVVLYKII